MSSGDDANRFPTLDGLDPEEINKFDQRLDYDGGPGSDVKDDDVFYALAGKTRYHNHRRVWKRRYRELEEEILRHSRDDTESVFRLTGDVDFRRREPRYP